jgi:CRP-like cAMP-binding protein
MAFGESVLLQPDLADNNRFFNAIALSDCLVLKLDAETFFKFVSDQEKKLVNEKVVFLRTVPEFSSTMLARSKLFQVCS